jgi:hypothetical protein
MHVEIGAVIAEQPGAGNRLDPCGDVIFFLLFQAFILTHPASATL